MHLLDLADMAILVSALALTATIVSLSAYRLLH
jgi:hypothetical protein